MKNLIIILPVLIILLIPSTVKCQMPDKGWDLSKLTGEKYVDNFFIRGQLFLSDEWGNGTIILENKDTLYNVFLKYNRYKDEIIYFNEKNSSTIKIDKSIVSEFYVSYNTNTYHFQKILYNDRNNDERYYEVLFSGIIDLLGYRKSEIINCGLYESASGLKKNQEFKPVNQYFLYTKKDGLYAISLSKKSLLLKYGESQRKEINKLLRKEKLRISNEFSLVTALKLLDQNGYKPNF